MRLFTSLLVICTLVLCVAPLSQAALFGGLKEEVQKELDSNPFLKKQGLKLKVVEVESGYVTIEIQDGNLHVRDNINSGHDLNSSVWLNSPPEVKHSINALEKSLEVIRGIDGVKAISLEALTNTPSDFRKKYPNAPNWLNSLVSNPIVPNIGLADLKIGDSKKEVIRKIGDPSQIVGNRGRKNNVFIYRKPFDVNPFEYCRFSISVEFDEKEEAEKIISSFGVHPQVRKYELLPKIMRDKYKESDEYIKNIDDNYKKYFISRRNRTYNYIILNGLSIIKIFDVDEKIPTGLTFVVPGKTEALSIEKMKKSSSNNISFKVLRE